MKKIIVLTFLMLAIGTPIVTFAQESVEATDENQDDLGNVSSEFKENFFNALAQKSIGNYDRAIDLLNKCATLQPSSGAVQFELAKNYFASDAFAKAEKAILKALELQGRNEWLLDLQYEIYSEQQEYEKALPVLEELVSLNKNFEELLPTVYYRNEKYEDALQSINKLNARLGENSRRKSLKRSIEVRLQSQERNDSNIDGLLEKIKNDPKDEQSYINLIYLYSRNKEKESLLKTAQELEKNVPNSDAAHLALYKVYLDYERIDDGIKSLERVLKSDQLDQKTKMKVLQDFINLSDNDKRIQDAVPQAIEWLSDDIEDPQAYKAMGDYYLKQKDFSKAIILYEKGFDLDDNNIDLIKSIALLSIDIEDYNKTLDITNQAIEKFPAQPLFYLLNGVAHNKLNTPDKAIETIEMGQSFILDEKEIERDMYLQLSIAYQNKGNSSKATSMKSKAQEISKKL